LIGIIPVGIGYLDVGIAVADLVISEIWAAGLAAWALWFVWHDIL